MPAFSAKNKKTLLVVAVIGVLALAYWIFDLTFIREKILGPATIQFGVKHIESPGNVAVASAATTFPANKPMIAWVARLNGSLGLTTVDLVLSKLTDSGGEIVLTQQLLNIADPTYYILYGIVNPLTLIVAGPGTYRFRVTSARTVFAQGEFQLSRTQTGKSK